MRSMAPLVIGRRRSANFRYGHEIGASLPRAGGGQEQASPIE